MIADKFRRRWRTPARRGRRLLRLFAQLLRGEIHLQLVDQFLLLLRGLQVQAVLEFLPLQSDRLLRPPDKLLAHSPRLVVGVGQHRGDQALGSIQAPAQHVAEAPLEIQKCPEGIQALTPQRRIADASWRRRARDRRALIRADAEDVDRLKLAQVGAEHNRVPDNVLCDNDLFGKHKGETHQTDKPDPLAPSSGSIHTIE